LSRGTRAAALVATAIAIIAAGCGGSSDDGEEITASSLSKAEFIARADAICAKGQRQVERNFGAYAKETDLKVQQITKKPTKEQVNGLVNTVLVPAIEEEIAEIRALGAPAGDEDKIEAMLEAMEEGIETAEGLPQKVLEQTGIAFGIGSRLAKEYGLTTCGQR
jgi:hypothetical protein